MKLSPKKGLKTIKIAGRGGAGTVCKSQEDCAGAAFKKILNLIDIFKKYLLIYDVIISRNWDEDFPYYVEIIKNVSLNLHQIENQYEIVF